MHHRSVFFGRAVLEGGGVDLSGGVHVFGIRYGGAGAQPRLAILPRSTRPDAAKIACRFAQGRDAGCRVSLHSIVVTKLMLIQVIDFSRFRSIGAIIAYKQVSTRENT